MEVGRHQDAGGSYKFHQGETSSQCSGSIDLGLEVGASATMACVTQDAMTG